MTFFQKLFSDPAVKAVVSNGAGILAASIDSAVQGGPTGGSAAWLATHPQAVPIYGFVTLIVHNYLSKYLPPSTVVSTQPTSPASPPKTTLPAPQGPVPL